MLLGREAECARLDGLLAGAREGRSGALVIRGEAGVGKSVLLQFAVERAGDLRVLSVRPVEVESELPFAGLADLVRPLSSYLAAIPAAQAAALAGALAIGPPVAGDRFTICAAALSLLAAAAEERPLLAVVDDLHWLDSASAETLLFTARRLGADGVALLFSLREAEGAGLDLTGIDALPLGGLERRHSAALLARDAARPVAAAVVDALHAATGGNPLALIEISGLLNVHQLAGREDLPDPLPAGPGLERAFRWRFGKLPAGSQRALLVAAASDSESMDIIAQAIEALGGHAAALAPAEDARLVRIDDGRVQFWHPLLRAAVYTSARPAERRAVHAALAQVLTRQGTLDRSAWHRAAAALGPDEEVAAALERTGMNAVIRSGYAAAARAFERAGQLSGTAEGRSRRYLQAAKAYHAAGRPDRGAHLLEEVLAISDDPVLRAETQLARGQIETWRGAPMAAHELLVAEADKIERLDPGMAARLLFHATVPCFMAARLPQALTTAERAYAVGRRAGPVADLAGAVVLEQARMHLGKPGINLQVAERALELLNDPEPQTAYELVVFVPFFLVFNEEFEKARGLLKRLVELGRRLSAPALLPFPLACLSELESRAGSWTAAYAAAFESVTLAAETGQDNTITYSLVCLARIEAALGREAECRMHVAGAVERSQRLGTDSILNFAQAALGFLELGLGRPERALGHLQDAAAFAAERELRDPTVVPYGPDLVEACIHLGRLDDAKRALTVLEQQAEQTRRRWALAAAARCRGLMADQDRFEEHFRHALVVHDQAPMPFERARTELCFGEMLRRFRRRFEAREHLRLALKVFDELGTEPWAARARNELSATGETVRPRRSPPEHRLTPQELQVSLAIAEGATNREAAARLFVSPKTIEAHLRNIYAKLDIRSRTELVRLVARQGTPDEPATVTGRR